MISQDFIPHTPPQKPTPESIYKVKLKIMYRQPTALPYFLHKKVARGSFASVYLGFRHEERDDSTRTPYAIKIIDLDTIDDLAPIATEVHTLRQHSSSCANLVRYFGSFLVGERLWVCMEWCVGSCFDLMNLDGTAAGDENGSTSTSLQPKNLTPFPEASIKTLLRSLLLGLNHLHSHLLMHRDIKCRNLLVTSRGVAKLSDFGESAQLTEQTMKRGTFVGSPFWMAPEVITQSLYSLPADIWSIGISALEMAHSHPPHHDAHPMKVLFWIPSKPEPVLDGDIWSEEFKDFISACLKKNVGDRKTAAQLLEMDFLNDDSGGREGDREIASRVEKRAEWMRRVEGGESLSSEESEEGIAFVEAFSEPPVKSPDSEAWTFEDDEDVVKTTAKPTMPPAPPPLPTAVSFSAPTANERLRVSQILRACAEEVDGNMGWKGVPSTSTLEVHLSMLPDGWLGIARDCDNNIVGGVEIDLSGSKGGCRETEAHSSRIKRVFVDKAARKNGYGGSIIDATLEFLGKSKSPRCKRVDMDVRCDNAPMITILEKSWKRIGVRKSMFMASDGELFDGVLYEKDLIEK